jgi:hypothetical protein
MLSALCSLLGSLVASAKQKLSVLQQQNDVQYQTETKPVKQIMEHLPTCKSPFMYGLVNRTIQENDKLMLCKNLSYEISPKSE